MPTFEYQAVDTQGAAVSGSIFGSSIDIALKQLAQKGLSVQKIGETQSHSDPLKFATPVAPQPSVAQAAPPLSTEQPGYRPAPTTERAEPYHGPSTFETAPMVPGPPTGPRSYFLTNVAGPVVLRANLVAVAFFFRQLGTMLRAAVPIMQSLDTLAGQTRDPRLRAVIEDCREQVRAGRPISAGLQRYPETISPVMISLIRAGEEGGFLDASVTQVADYVDREIELRNIYRRVTFLPKLEFVASFIVILATNAIIKSMGKEGGIAMPFTPLIWTGIIIFAIAVFLYLRIGLANPAIKRTHDGIVLRIPVIGKTMHGLAMAKFGRAFGALYKGGVPIVKAMHLAADACGNEHIRSVIRPSFDRMDSGHGVFETLASTRAFSPIVMDMVKTGETTGNMDEMLTRMSEYYESEAVTRQNMVAAIVGVLMIIVVGAYIGYIVITFWTGYASGVMKFAQ